MSHFKPREDAVWHSGRRFVPTIYGQHEGNTQWVATQEEFRAAGGCTTFSEDQTEIYLTLPAGWKFSIQFNRPELSPSRDELLKLLNAVLDANDDFRAGMPEGWEGDPLQDACIAARNAINATGKD